MELPRLDKALRKEKGPAKCHITGTIDKPKIAIEDASLVLRQPDRKEPIIAVDGINLNMQVEKTASGLVLAVEPVEVFKKAKLSVVAANGLVSLIAPDVEAERQVTGEISLSLSTVRIPLGVSQGVGQGRLEAEGKLTLHHVTTEVKKPMWQALIKLLADMNGKQPSNVVRLVDGAEIQFQLRDGRLHHDGFRVGFPEIDPELVVSSRGSIGVDETLDLHVEFPRLRKDKRDKGPVKCHITGTLSEPKISVPDASLVVQLTDTDKATLTVDNVNLTFGVETSKDGADADPGAGHRLREAKNDARGGRSTAQADRADPVGTLRSARRDLPVIRDVPRPAGRAEERGRQARRAGRQAPPASDHRVHKDAAGSRPRSSCWPTCTARNRPTWCELSRMRKSASRCAKAACITRACASVFRTFPRT